MSHRRLQRSTTHSHSRLMFHQECPRDLCQCSSSLLQHRDCSNQPSGILNTLFSILGSIWFSLELQYVTICSWYCIPHTAHRFGYGSFQTSYQFVKTDLHILSHKWMQRRVPSYRYISPDPNQGPSEKGQHKRRHQRHHQRQPGEQLFPIQVATG